MRSKLIVGEQIPALAASLTDGEVVAFAAFLKSIERLRAPAPCILLEESVLARELAANLGFQVEVGPPSFVQNDSDKTPSERVQDLIASLVNKFSIAK